MKAPWMVPAALLGLGGLMFGAGLGTAPIGVSATTSDGADDTPAGVFYDALRRRPERRLESLAALTDAVLRPDPEPRDVLLLGLNHLWISAEGEQDSRSRFRHSILAHHWLRRAERLLPDDSRIPTWRLSAEWAIAVQEGRPTDAEAARDRISALADDDPCFHAVTLGITSFREPAGSAAFRRAHAAMEASFRCRADDPSVQNRPRWPHNVQAFLVGLSDFRLKAGDVAGAEAALVIAESRPGFARWTRRHLVDERFADLADRTRRFANADPLDDPPFVFEPGGPVSCIACHGR